MDADKIFRRADFSQETDFEERLWLRLMKSMQTWEGELDDDFMADVAAAGADPPLPKKPKAPLNETP